MRGALHEGSGAKAGALAAMAASIACVLAAAFAGPADAAKQKPARVLLAGEAGKWKLLVPLRPSLDQSGLETRGRVKVGLPGSAWSANWEAHAHGGGPRPGDQRSSFFYRHGIRVPSRVARAILRNRGKAGVSVAYRTDRPLAGQASEAVPGPRLTQARVRRAAPGVCENLPRIVAHPNRGPRAIALPACGRSLRWRIAVRPTRGRASLSAGRLVYRPAKGVQGSDRVTLVGRFRSRDVARQTIELRVVAADPAELSVIAFGDSVTAGFGYFGKTGKQMTIGQLFGCKPGDTFLNDACSSNSTNRSSSVGSKPDFLPDFGLSRNISWAAQWANEYGITDYENYAVTGSAPTDWLPNGQFHATLESIEAQDPDYILMTLGANPLLSDVLFGVDNMDCALESDLFGDFRQCVLDAFESVDLDGNMNAVFTELARNTTSRIVVMEYPLSVPSSAIAYSAAQLEMMGELLNEVVGAEAADVSAERITQVSPPRFNVGIDMEPLYPSRYSCSFLGYEVDGPSVQSTPTQDELEAAHPLSFCSGPAVGQPWVISGDTGIHPSTAGYSQMASQIPAPSS